MSEQNIDESEPGACQLPLDFDANNGESMADAWSRLTPEKDSETTSVRVLVLRPFAF